MSEYTPTTDEIRYRVEHDWYPYGDGSFDRWLSQHEQELREQIATQAAIRCAALFEIAWDEGNAMGLDGWIGPERGEDPDEHATRRRERSVDRLVDLLQARIARKE